MQQASLIYPSPLLEPHPSSPSQYEHVTAHHYQKIVLKLLEAAKWQQVTTERLIGSLHASPSAAGPEEQAPRPPAASSSSTTTSPSTKRSLSSSQGRKRDRAMPSELVPKQLTCATVQMKTTTRRVELPSVRDSKHNKPRYSLPVSRCPRRGLVPKTLSCALSAHLMEHGYDEAGLRLRDLRNITASTSPRSDLTRAVREQQPVYLAQELSGSPSPSSSPSSSSSASPYASQASSPLSAPSPMTLSPAAAVAAIQFQMRLPTRRNRSHGSC